MDVIKSADYVIGLGPEGRRDGGAYYLSGHAGEIGGLWKGVYFWVFGGGFESLLLAAST